MPTTKHRIAVNLDDQEFAALTEMADKHDVSLGWLGRQALLEFLDRYRNEQLPLPLRREARLLLDSPAMSDLLILLVCVLALALVNRIEVLDLVAVLGLVC